MPRSHDPSRVELLRKEGGLTEKRVSISVEDIRGAVANWKNSGGAGDPITPYPLPQFFLQPPSTAGGGSRNGVGSKEGSVTSLRMPLKKAGDDVDLGYY